MIAARFRALPSRLASIMLAAMIAGAAAGAAEVEIELPSAPIDSSDVASMQRGAKMFVNYCIGCHGAALITFDRVAEDLGIGEDVMRDHLRFGAAAQDRLSSAMDDEEARAWFYEAVPPDLSLIARSRGVDWLFGYLRGFYRDESRPSGWNNLLFPNAAMPHVMSDLQGEARRGADGGLRLESPGALDAVAYDRAVADLVNFLDYVGEPTRAERERFGYLLMPLLFLFMAAAYFLYRERWRELH